MVNLKKNRVKRETKQFIKNRLNTMLLNKAEELSERILDNFLELEEYIINTDSGVDIMYYYNILSDRLEDFEYFDDNVSSMKFVLPDMDNFDFRDLEFVELLFNGFIGIYAEATLYEVLELFGAEHNLQPINPLAPAEEHIYLVLVTDWLMARESDILGYSLPRLPFSNTEPLYDRVLGEVEDYVEENMDTWVSESIEESMEILKQTYGVR